MKTIVVATDFSKLSDRAIRREKLLAREFDSRVYSAIDLMAELIVIGTCGRSVISRVRMGSVTEGVLRQSDRDVLAIPPQQDGAVS